MVSCLYQYTHKDPQAGFASVFQAGSNGAAAKGPGGRPLEQNPWLSWVRRAPEFGSRGGVAGLCPRPGERRHNVPWKRLAPLREAQRLGHPPLDTFQMARARLVPPQPSHGEQLQTTTSGKGWSGPSQPVLLRTDPPPRPPPLVRLSSVLVLPIVGCVAPRLPMAFLDRGTKTGWADLEPVAQLERHRRPSSWDSGQATPQVVDSQSLGQVAGAAP